MSGGTGSCVGYLGPRGTFTHQAAMAMRPDAELIALPDTAALVDALRAGTISHAVLPMDNTVNGPVMPTVDTMLGHPDLVITGDHVLRVSFNAYARADDDREPAVVVSHPHALAQVREYVAGLGVPTQVTSSTAAAVEGLAPGQIAVAAPVCGDLYDVRRVAAEIEDSRVAFTTFVELTLRGTGDESGSGPSGPGDSAGKPGGDAAPAGDAAPSGDDGGVTGMLFVLQPSKDHPGALFEILAPLRERGLNLTNIITRPVAASPGEYVFLLLVDGAVPAGTVDALLGFWRSELHCAARLAGPLVGRPPRGGAER